MTRFVVGCAVALGGASYCSAALFFTDETLFNAAAAAFSIAGMEDFESSVLGPSLTQVFDDSLAPGVASSPSPIFPSGTNPAIGMTVQSNTLGGMPSTVSPRGANGLQTTSFNLFGTPTDQVNNANPGDSFDMLFSLSRTAAVSFNPLVLDLDATDVGGTANIRVFDKGNGLIFDLDNIPVASFTNPTTFFGVVASPGEDIGRINVYATTVGTVTDPNDLYSGADNVRVYVPEPPAGAYMCLATAASVLSFGWMNFRACLRIA